jgi:hypothetical protein
MFKILLPFFLGVLSSSCYADTLCPTGQGQYNVQFDTQPLKYDYSKTSKELTAISQNKNNTENHSVHTGLFYGYEGFDIEPVYSLIQNNNDNSPMCGKIKTLNLIIHFQPTIYIAKETEGLPCLAPSVVHHEETHYKIAMQALNYIHDNVGNFLLTNYEGYLYAANKNEMTQKVNEKNQYVVQSIKKMFDEKTIPLHAELDSPENYKKETMACPVRENVILHKRVR